MDQVDINATVGEIVTRKPGLARVFEQLGIDYCCGGKVPLADACRERSIDPQRVIKILEDKRQEIDNQAAVDVSSMSLTELADHIEQTHHVYLKSELPRLCAMTEKVASVHGERDQRLTTVRDTFIGLANELSSHMMKEEGILFPMVRQLDSGADTTASHCGTIAAPINQMEAEHADAGIALAQLQSLTDGHAAPEWACNTYRALLDGLQNFEYDLHQHIHKENNVLFPRAIELEKKRTAVA